MSDAGLRAACRQGWKACMGRTKPDKAKVGPWIHAWATSPTSAQLPRREYPYSPSASCAFHAAVNADQWNNFLRFSCEVRPDLSNVEENPAWPVLLDK